MSSSCALLKVPPEALTPEAAIARHPLALAQNAAIEEVKAREKALNRSYYPHFNLEGTTYARGTGVDPSGVTGGVVVQRLLGGHATLTFQPLQDHIEHVVLDTSFLNISAVEMDSKPLEVK